MTAPVCTVEYIEDGKIAVLRMIKGDNRFNLEFLNDFLKCLDEAESNPDVKVLITTGSNKFYSNGLDLDKLQTYSSDEALDFFRKNQTLHRRLLTFSKPTIAAINGHAYAAGGILALTHDYLIMREERGWFCLPEVKLQRRFFVLMDFLKAKIPQTEHINCLVMGKRYTAKEALEVKIIHHACHGEKLMEEAVDWSRKLIKENYNPQALQQLKIDLYEKECESLNTVSKL